MKTECLENWRLVKGSSICSLELLTETTSMWAMNKNFSDIIMQSHYIYSVTFNPHFVDTHIDIVQWQMEIPVEPHEAVAEVSKIENL